MWDVISSVCLLDQESCFSGLCPIASLPLPSCALPVIMPPDSTPTPPIYPGTPLVPTLRIFTPTQTPTIISLFEANTPCVTLGPTHLLTSRPAQLAHLLLLRLRHACGRSRSPPTPRAQNPHAHGTIPRRTWDLHSHRARATAPGQSRTQARTPVSEQEWLVPRELRRLGAEYVRLDGRTVESPARKDSVRTDMPAVTVVRYCNGLGCAFTAGGLALGAPRRRYIPARVCCSRLSPARNTTTTPTRSRRLRPLADISFGANQLAMVVREMKLRGGYLIRALRLPVYD